MDLSDLPDCSQECSLAGHRARWLPNGVATFAAMSALVAAATESICLEFYMVRPGEPALSLLAGLLAQFPPVRTALDHPVWPGI